MSENLKNNPFAQLFPSLEAAKQYSKECEANFQKNFAVKMPENAPRSETIPNQRINLNDKIEHLFGISLDSASKNQVVFLQDVALSTKQTWLDLEILEQALFERLFIDEPVEHLLNGDSSSHVVEKNVLIYLNDCYERVVNLGSTRPGPELKTMQELILRNMATALKQQELYSSQDIHSQFSEILTNCKHKFINGLIDELEKDDEEARVVLIPFLEYLHVKLKKATLGAAFIKEICECLLQLAGNQTSAAILMEFTTPKAEKLAGVDYGKTLFGDILNLSCLPKSENFQFDDYFLKNSGGNGDFERDTDVIWHLVADLNQSVYQIFNALLRSSPEVNRKLVAWISNCLIENKDLGKLWRAYGPRSGLFGNNVCTGFMVNLGAVLLRLCLPILTNDSKIMKIDPTFGATGIFTSETCLIPADERPTAETYNFITEIFFLTHKTVDLGFRVGNELFIQAAKDMATLNSMRRDASRSWYGETSEGSEELTRQASVMRSYYAAIFEPKARDLILKLNVATAKWIVQIILDVGEQKRESYHIRELRELTFPLPEDVPNTLACIPEFMIENLIWHLALLFKVKEIFMELYDLDIMIPIVTMIIVLSRGKKRVKNPHLRAGLIGCLECLVPKSDEKNRFSNPRIFEMHPHINELIPSLLDVFVSIEMTGESVQFEQKFKYRQPIYVLMECLWSYEVHRKRFKALAAEAEANMEAVDPPIFLRFFNLLINDAVFLLDEALSNMAQLKTMELARDSEEYSRKSASERQQDDAMFRHTGLIAKFDNILGRWTVKTLQFLTTEIKSIVTHPAMVDRVASMLNYFLHNFVGPNKKNLTVKDKQEYDFNPGEIVLIISQIYANLSACDNFCLAISRDGRSYNPRLFVDAEHVLCRINGSSLVPAIREVAARVAKMASKQKRHDELMADAPEEFFDPIMSTIMTDPVILPTSHVTVDRSTIARHLLSDQTDPFNRAPLSMDMVKPNDELRLKIDNWTAERSKADEEK